MNDEPAVPAGAKLLDKERQAKRGLQQIGVLCSNCAEYLPSPEAVGPAFEILTVVAAPLPGGNVGVGIQRDLICGRESCQEAKAELMENAVAARQVRDPWVPVKEPVPSGGFAVDLKDGLGRS